MEVGHLAFNVPEKQQYNSAESMNIHMHNHRASDGGTMPAVPQAAVTPCSETARG